MWEEPNALLKSCRAPCELYAILFSVYYLVVDVLLEEVVVHLVFNCFYFVVVYCWCFLLFLRGWITGVHKKETDRT